MDPVRLVIFQVYDGVFFSDPVVGFVNITLRDDNPPMLECGSGMVSFIEDSVSPVPLATYLSLSDLDSDHVLTGAIIAITNPQEGDEILINSSVSNSVRIQSSTSSRIELVGDATDLEYQVRKRKCCFRMIIFLPVILGGAS